MGINVIYSGTVAAAREAALRGLRGLALSAGAFLFHQLLAWPPHEDEALLIAMPCAHIGGTGLGVMAIGAGARAIVQEEFTPDGVLDAFEQGATRMFIVPAALQMVIQHPRAKHTDFSAVKYVFYGAAPIPLGGGLGDLAGKRVLDEGLHAAGGGAAARGPRRTGESQGDLGPFVTDP